MQSVRSQMLKTIGLMTSWDELEDVVAHIPVQAQNSIPVKSIRVSYRSKPESPKTPSLDYVMHAYHQARRK